METTETPTIVSDPDFHEKHWRSSAVKIGPIVNNHDETGQVVAPFCHCRVITENGQFWGIYLPAFVATEENVGMAWDQKPSAFERINMKVSQ